VVAVIRPRSPDHDQFDDENDDDQPDGGHGYPRRRWRAFTDLIDRHAWTIVVVGVALILFDVLTVLVLVLLQVAP
jgi:hypothetical protein